MFGDQASIEIAASADLIYDQVADVINTPELSPEVRHVEWLGQPARPIVGARFRGRNRWLGFTWWRTVRIVQADRGREFVFQTEPGRGIYHNATTWRYRLEPVGDGTTRVTEKLRAAGAVVAAVHGHRARPAAGAAPRHAANAGHLKDTADTG